MNAELNLKPGRSKTGRNQGVMQARSAHLPNYFNYTRPHINLLKHGSGGLLSYLQAHNIGCIYQTPIRACQVYLNPHGQNKARASAAHYKSDPNPKGLERKRDTKAGLRFFRLLRVHRTLDCVVTKSFATVSPWPRSKDAIDHLRIIPSPSTNYSSTSAFI
jgi:hypothetical protein